jgi:signal transduction histidine kinase/tetratricopeptide (TPR) repeat protein/putative methionine-R-sulfoxide reductase with GAF domain
MGHHAWAIEIISLELKSTNCSEPADICVRDYLDLLDTRAESYYALGKLELAEQDTEAMMQRALAAKKTEYLVQAFNRKAFMQMRAGDLKSALETAESAAKMKHAFPGLQAASLFRLGEAQFRTGLNDAAIHSAEQAAALFETAGDKSGAGRAHWVISVAYFHLGRVEESRRAAQSALDLCQEAGDRYGTGNAWIGYSNTDLDSAERILHLQMALKAFDAAGYAERKTVALVNLGLAYYELGLYPRARRVQNEAVETARPLGAKLSLAYGLINLVDAEISSHALDMVQSHLNELQAITPGLNDPTHDATLALLMGHLALIQGDPKTAVEHIQNAVTAAHHSGLGNEAIFLAKLGQAYLAGGSDPGAALQATTAATELHRAQSFAKPDGFTSQEIWWRHAQALKANRKKQEVREAVEIAYDLMLKSIATLRDEGLRRNFLNKVEVNREIIDAWIQDGLKRKLSSERLYAHLSIESNVREPFKRLADTGLRLNTLHTIDAIQAFLVEEAVELSGGERVLLIVEKDHRREVAEAFLPAGEDAQLLLRTVEPYLNRTRLSRAAQLIPQIPAHQEGQHRAPKAGCVVAPLIAQNNLLGYLYVEMSAVYGSFTEVDRDMIGLLANQAAVALANSQWAQGLEQMVQERTRQLQERVDELQIINAIQQGFTVKLDFQAVVDLVGDHLRQAFHTPDIGIRWYDEKANLVHYLYEYEHGRKIQIPPQKPNPGGIWEQMIQTHAPIIFKNAADYGDTPPFPGTDQSKSLVSVPIIRSDRMVGSILLENYERENAYGESELRLLTTIAATLGTVLESAHLFDETQRLFIETKQRAAELEIINSISLALTHGLDLHTMIDLVGDKLRETIGAANIGIGFYEPETNELHVQYAFMDNVRIHHDPVKLSEFTVNGAKKGRSLVINKNAEKIWPLLGSNLTMEGMVPKSVVIVPILAAKTLIGGITLQDFEKEGAYSPDFVRLLETIAFNMGTAIRNAQLFDETQRLLQETAHRAAELSAINTVSQALVAVSDADNLIQLVGDQMREIFDADIVYLALIDRQTGVIHFPYAYGDPSIQPIKIGQGLTSKILETGQPLLINSNISERSTQLGTKRLGKVALSYLGVPITVDGSPIGVVSVQSTQREGVFNDDSLHLLTTIAANAGAAIHSAQLHAETQRRALETAALLDISRDISASLDLPTVLKGIAAHARNLLDGELSALFLPEGDGKSFRAIAAVGDDVEEIRNEMIRLGEGILGHIAQNKVGEIFNNVDQDPRALNIAGTQNYSHEHLLAVPLMAGNALKGLMAVWRTGPGLVFREHELDFLNGLARQAVIAIQNARLFAEAHEARAAAEQANKAKSTFLANMSHELRTPLNAIMGFTRIVRRKSEGLLPEKQMENLDKVLASSDHLLGLINTVLDIAKIEAGRMDVIPASFDIRAVMEQCASLTLPLLRPNVVLEKNIGGSINRIYSDQDKIKQIIFNLLSNAAKFTHAGKIALSIDQLGPNLLRISVADDGIGISPEALSRIFDEFQQADASTTRQYGGTGLGLTISRNLAMLLGGELTAASQVGHGSTFNLIIPIHYQPKASPSLPSLGQVSSSDPVI